MLEYASPTWSPYLTYQKDLIESVQRSFTKRLPGFNNLLYMDRLAKLNLQSLEQRRLMADLKMCYDIVHGLTCLNFDDSFVFSQYLSTRGHRFKLIVPISKSNIRKYFFAARVVPIWNSLPEKLVTAFSPHVFKKLLFAYDLSVFLSYPCTVLYHRSLIISITPVKCQYASSCIIFEHWHRISLIVFNWC